MTDLQIQSTDNLTNRSLPDEIPSDGLQTPPILANRYQVVRTLGNGSQGYLYKAIDKQTQKAVAIKQLRIDLVEDWKSYTLFAREAKVLSELELNGVAKFHAYYECLDNDHPCAYLVQDYIDGISLEDKMMSGARYSVSRIFEIALQLVDILEKLHTHTPPIIHRDLKPGNIMICQENGHDKVYLIDFGAVANPQIQGGGSTVAGTYGYMPPEQLMGKPEPASDLYALAATICYMLCGVSPADMQTLDFKLIIEPHLQSLPNAVSRVLSTMLAPAVKDRLTDYQTIRTYFEAFKKSQFDILDREKSDMSFYATPQYEEQLKNVKTLWDNDNLILWEALPEQTPRPVHACMQILTPVDLCSHKTITKNKITREVSWFTSFMVWFFIGGIILMIGYSIIYFLFQAFAGEIAPLRAILSLGLGSAFIYALFQFFCFCYNVDKPEWTRYYKPSYNRAENCRELMMCGRKTIATITSISYKNYSSTDIEKYSFQNQKEGIYLHNIPQFEIAYKFNPLDDSLTEDLVHRIIIHRDPRAHLTVGDPLPILYNVSIEDNSRVESMPFPFACCDVNIYSDIICITKNGQIV